jgi:hypothetical protein
MVLRGRLGHPIGAARWKDSVRSGDKIEVGFYRLKDGSRDGQLMNVKLENGQKLCSNRGCGDGTGSIVPGDYQP